MNLDWDQPQDDVELDGVDGEEETAKKLFSERVINERCPETPWGSEVNTLCTAGRMLADLLKHTSAGLPDARSHLPTLLVEVTARGRLAGARA
eukprot:jgi/Tetstr1/463409/TSEL_008331.t1